MDPQEFKYLCELIRSVSGMQTTSDKQTVLEARAVAFAHEEKIPSLCSLLSQLQSPSSAELRTRFVERVAIQETYFYRDSKPFDALREHIIPSLMRQRVSTRSLCLLSIACATGQEPYSLAMLIRESFPSLASWHVKILGMDFSREALRRARLGRYNEIEASRGLPAALLAKYFTRQGDVYEANPELRAAVQFNHMNLIEQWPSIPSCDVLMLRNVLIYFDLDAKRQILERVKRVLSPGGFMFLGGSETTLGVHDDFIPVRIGTAVCYQVRGKAVASGPSSP